MNRRSLFAVGVPLGLLVAGCLGGPTRSDGSGDGDGSSVRDTSFEVLDVRSSSEDETTSVTFEDGTITVSGTIGGNNGCYTARLADATVGDGTLTVSVESYEDAGEGRDCTQALVVIEYRATVTTDGNPPASVTVEHGGNVVSSAHRS
ncbi:MAG: hypothetical protein V5A62_06860 [Haloarculaceae archaeon]